VHPWDAAEAATDDRNYGTKHQVRRFKKKAKKGDTLVFCFVNEPHFQWTSQ